MGAETAVVELADLGYPPEDMFDSEEQDEPLAGQDHIDTVDSLSYPLRGRLAGPGCYVAAELRVHRNRNNLRDYREPDILVAFGVRDWVRPRYEIWVEGKAPDLVIELLSPSSWQNSDLIGKRAWYRREGVREYVVLDPLGAFAPIPRMQAWLLGDRADGSADTHRAPAEGETLWSELIPFGWRVVGEWVRVVDRASDALFPLIADVEPTLRREVALRRAAQEQARLAQEQARLAEEQARLAAEQAQAAQARERQATERERLAEERVAQWQERAEQEAAMRRALEEEIARLRKEQE